MATNYLRPNQIEEYEREKQIHRNVIERPDPRGELNKGESQLALRRIDEALQQAPPDLTPAQRDKAQKIITKLEEEIKDGMLSHEEMRRCPPGATDAHRRWTRLNKQRIIDWKNAQLALNKGIAPDEAEHLCNVDRLRPRTSQLGMDGAVIPQTRMFSFPSEAFKSAWDEIFNKEDPEKARMRVELEALRAQNAEKVKSAS